MPESPVCAGGIASSGLCHCGFPEYRFNPQFVHFMDENDKVMTENFTKRFIEESGISLASERVTEFPLHHAEGRFNIGALVVVLQIFFSLEHEVVKHLLPQRGSFAGCIALESDKRSPIVFDNRGHVRCASIGSVRRYLANGERFCCGFYQGRELCAIARVLSTGYAPLTFIGTVFQGCKEIRTCPIIHTLAQ